MPSWGQRQVWDLSSALPTSRRTLAAAIGVSQLQEQTDGLAAARDPGASGWHVPFWKLV